MPSPLPACLPEPTLWGKTTWTLRPATGSHPGTARKHRADPQPDLPHTTRPQFSHQKNEEGVFKEGCYGTMLSRDSRVSVGPESERGLGQCFLRLSHLGPQKQPTCPAWAIFSKAATEEMNFLNLTLLKTISSDFKGRQACPCILTRPGLVYPTRTANQ